MAKPKSCNSKKPIDEQSYIEGNRMAWLAVIQRARQELEGDDAASVRWFVERQRVLHTLRSLCAEFGDNEWPDDAYLPDVLEKHLGDHLRSA